MACDRRHDDLIATSNELGYVDCRELAILAVDPNGLDVISKFHCHWLGDFLYARLGVCGRRYCTLRKYGILLAAEEVMRAGVLNLYTR